MFTIGYEGVNLSDFLDILNAQGISQLIDVREHAFSMKRGFSKAPLRTALQASGIRYDHFRMLGAPKPVRAAYKATADWNAYCQDYNQYLETQTDALEELARLSRTERIVLLCFEANAMECHRSLITQKLESQNLINNTIHIPNKTKNLDYALVG